MAAPSLGVLHASLGEPVASKAKHRPMIAVRIIAQHLNLLVRIEIGEAGFGTLMAAPPFDVFMVNRFAEVAFACG